ncbi:hypothetical protein IMZ48_45065, partial [Candidatus Bathyarchaeota archaeon]|nr:hypothetical protein [Candidatus Bathyarchaeota archaeon]
MTASRPWAMLSRRARLRSRAFGPRRTLTAPLPARRDFSTTPSHSVIPHDLASTDTHDAHPEPEARQHRAPTYTPRLPPMNAIQSPKLSARPTTPTGTPRAPRRKFHNYFVTHLPSSSLHPDRRPPPGPGHGLPRHEASPHTPNLTQAPATIAAPGLAGRDLTVVRIPLRSAKHH